jgi:Zn-dependent M28 family amino/carboxypeptidase
MQKRVRLQIVLLLVVVMGWQLPSPVAAGEVSTAALREAVTVEGIYAHLTALQFIADASGGNRAAGAPGYDLSALYVYNQLALAGYQVTLQPFEFPYFQELAPPEMELMEEGAAPLRAEVDFTALYYSSGGEVTAPLQVVDLTLPPDAPAATFTSGCEAGDFAGFTRGNIALLQRGTCPFAQKVANAEAAGAVAVVLFNDGRPGNTGLIMGSLGAPVTSLPVIGTTFAVGQELAARLEEEPVILRVQVNSIAETRTTVNVLAEMPGGRDGCIVMMGAHLDSVAAGPGINDNGSGSALVLEIARQVAALGIRPENKIRFAFWGAEELGLLGSRHYVSQLKPDELQAIATYLNFDMVGSPNFVRFVYSGGPRSSRMAPGDAGFAAFSSEAVTQLFEDYFAMQGLPTELLAMGGGSDSASFIAAAIPAGGLFTGANGIKSREQAAIYGGIAGEPYDACYHQPCDNLANINLTAIEQLSEAAAHTLLHLAMAVSPVNGMEFACRIKQELAAR